MKHFSDLKLIRYAVAYVFIISGLMKFFSGELARHFLSLGMPYPHTMLNLVMIAEIGCGLLILCNKKVRYATIPLIAIMISAILLAKLPTLNNGFLVFAFNSRLDIVMLVLLVILYYRTP